MNGKRIIKIVLRVVGVLLTAVLIFGWGYKGLVVSPLAGVCLAISGTVCVIPLIFSLICIVFPRVFCKYFCPLGAMLSIIYWIERKTFPPRLLTIHNRTTRFIPNLKYVTLITTLIGAILGVPTFLFLDPTALIKGACTFNRYSWGVILVPVILILCVISPLFWCTRFCPLGALQDALSVPIRFFRRRIHISPSPAAVAKRRYDFAVSFFSLLGVGCFLFSAKSNENAKSKESDTEGLEENSQAVAFKLRFPPGVNSKLKMASQCARCGACVQACPTNLIQPISQKESLLLWGAPKLDYHSDSESPAFCDSNCNACTQVCPVGAITPLSLEEKNAVVLSRVILDFSYCRLNFENECAICVTQCPRNAISKEWSEQQYLTVLIINYDLCTGCGICASQCPGTNGVRALKM